MFSSSTWLAPAAGWLQRQALGFFLDLNSTSSETFFLGQPPLFNWDSYACPF